MSIQSTTPIINLPDIAFLAVQALAGNIIIAIGATSTTGVMVSYTPANGKRFIILNCGVIQDTNRSITTAYVLVRNNGVQHDLLFSTIGNQNKDVISGDILIGNGILTYDMYLYQSPILASVTATFKGFIF